MEASLGELLLHVCRELDRGKELLGLEHHVGRKVCAVFDVGQLLRSGVQFFLQHQKMRRIVDSICLYPISDVDGKP